MGPSSLTGLGFQRVVGVVSKRHRELRGRSDNAGKPDDGNDADQDVDDLSGRRARIHRGIGLRSIGRNRATRRDQRGEPDERERLRIELSGLDSGSADAARRKAGVVDGQTAQPLRVVQTDSPFLVIGLRRRSIQLGLELGLITEDQPQRDQVLWSE